MAPSNIDLCLYILVTMRLPTFGKPVRMAHHDKASVTATEIEWASRRLALLNVTLKFKFK